MEPFFFFFKQILLSHVSGDRNMLSRAAMQLTDVFLIEFEQQQSFMAQGFTDVTVSLHDSVVVQCFYGVC